ncbi:hypothetical protein AB0C87_20345 [Actinomadura sp. NPDC048021]|uniref:hypothetical protein n=1 Tax=Actinomadura sp. NPDC048021 TaxID=3155385 RepID=UPI0033FBB414
MKKRQPLWRTVRQSSTDLYRRATAKRIRVISIVIGAVFGAVVQGIAMGASWMGAAGPADLDLLVSAAIFGARYGLLSGVCGVLIGACAPGTADQREAASRTAARITTVGVALSFVMAAFSIAGLDIAKGHPTFWLALPVFCGVGTGMVVGIRDAVAVTKAAADV